MRGDDVQNVQQNLVEAGFPIDVDGIFGPRTNEAVLQFQQQRELVVDGSVSSTTLTTLEF